MPHILLESNCSSERALDGFISFKAVGKYDEKIGIEFEKKEFLLTKVKKGENDLVKLDIPTRLSPVSLMKKALNGYAEQSGQKILFSNTNSIYNKVKPEEKYLKEIEYFLNEFQTDKKILVEVGFGSGTHLLHQAKQNPDKLVIGLEIHTPSTEQVLKQLSLQNIENVLVLNYDARLFLETLDSNCVSKIFVHFPVPWDKKPHRRVMSYSFISESMRVLEIEGTLELRTDSPNYFAYNLELLKEFRNYPFKILKNNDLEVTSKYEARWKRQEKTIWDIIISANENSPQRVLEGDFGFPYQYDKQRLQEKFTNKTVKKEEFIIHLEDIYDIRQPFEGLLIKLTMGGFNKPVTKYLLLEESNLRYFQGEPIRTRLNLEAHKELLELLK
jgi:tRNA (guanine-N7-)-methyltransferase